MYAGGQGSGWHGPVSSEWCMCDVITTYYERCCVSSEYGEYYVRHVAYVVVLGLLLLPPLRGGVYVLRAM